MNVGTGDTEHRTVWIVEDNTEFRRQLRDVLNLSAEFVCTHDFRRVESMLELLAGSSPPDILLMDIGLPGIDGIEGTTKAKMLSPSTEVVILTVFDDNENLVRAIAAGATGYLHKSATLEEIAASLRSILYGGAPINPSIARRLLSLFSAGPSSRNQYSLTNREREILGLLIEDIPLKQIADRLSISIHTINMHLRNIYAKLQVQSRSGAVAKALKEGLL
jgi:DNA-binding NarL/FixJ family response regulator